MKATTLTFVIPTEAKRSGGTRGSRYQHPIQTKATTLTFVIPSAAEGSAVLMSTSRAAMMNRWSRIARRIRVPTGFLFAAFYLWRARPSATSLAFSLLLVAPGLLLRAYASGYVKKNAELTMTGPYAYTRNPLYLGSILIAFGFVAASRSLWTTLVLALLFAVIYAPTIYGEEQFLRSTFPAFESYAKSVPRLLPRLTPAPLEGFHSRCRPKRKTFSRFSPKENHTSRASYGQSNCETPLEGEGGFSGALYRQHREYNSLLGACAVYAVLVAALLLRH
jgi:protein-S-isoprenylcysteine O-methyltransferase Ste14